MSKPKKIYEESGYEFYQIDVESDDQFGTVEIIFLSPECDDFIGEFDSTHEAIEYCKVWVKDRQG